LRGHLLQARSKRFNLLLFNFVAFTIRYKRTEKIDLHISIYPSEIEDREVLPLYAGRWLHYMRCEITSARQLACAARYIEASYAAWHHDTFGK